MGMREGAVSELMGVHKGGVGVVEEEGRRLVKGLEGIIRKAEKRKGVVGDGNMMKDKVKEREMWEKVVGKVEEKFWEKAGGMQNEVREWYAGVRDREGAEVRAF